MIKKSKSTDSVGKQLEDQVAQAKTGFAEAGSKLTHAINGKDIQLGNKQKIAVKNKFDEENFDLSLDAGAESAADPIVLAQAEATVMADAAAASPASSAAGAAGAEAGAGAAAGAAAGTAAMSVGTMAMIGAGVVAVGVAASSGSSTAAAAPAGDTTAPAIQSMTAAGSTVVLTYNEALDAVNVPVAGNFAVTVGGVANAVTGVAVAGMTVTLTLTNAVATGAAVQVIYTDPTAGNDVSAIQDAAGNDAVSFTTGVVADGYIRGAQIYIDTNSNGVADAGELLTGVVTNANGNFILPAGTPAGAVIATGGVNIDTGVPNTLVLKAPAGSTVISPLTTLVQAYIAQNAGTSVANASATIVTSLGLAAGTDLTTYDPLAALAVNVNDAAALVVQRAAVQVATVVALAAATPAGTTTSADAATAVFTNLVTQMGTVAAPTAVDLTNAAAITTALGTASTAVAATITTATTAISVAATPTAISTAQSVALDTVTPVAPVVALAAASDTGSSATDTITSDTTPTVRVSLNTTATDGTAAVINNTVAVLNGSSAQVGTATLTTTDIANGYVDITIAPALVGDGTHTFTATITDAANHASAASTALTLTLDTTASTNTIVSPVFSADTGSSATDLITNTAAQTISGTLGANLATGEFVQVSLDNGATWVTATATVGQNTWSLATTLTASNTLQVRVSDTAGNTGAAITQAYVLDTTNPVTISGASFSADTGASSTDFITNTAAQTITVTLSAAPAGTDTVYGSLDNGTTWVDVTGSVAGTTLTMAGITLTGSNTLQVKVVDIAGNISIASQAYVLDTTAPTLASSTPVDGSTTAVATDNIVLTFSENVAVGSGNIVITNANNAGDTRTIAVGNAQVTIGTTAVTINPTADLALGGTYNMQIASGAVTDIAGNAYAGIADATTLNFVTANNPSVTITSDRGSLKIGDTAALTFTLSEAATDFTAADITVTGGTLSNFAGSGTTYTASFTPTASSTTAATVNVASGVFTNAATFTNTAATQLSMTVDTVAPTLSSSTPADNATNVSGSIVLTFSEAVQAGTGNIVITDGVTPFNIAVGDTTQVAFSGTTVTITPTTAPAPSTAYSIQLASGVINDAAGNAYAGIANATTLNFTTAAAPTLTSTIDNVTNFDVTSNIVLTASENVTAVATKYIHIINDGGTGFHGEATVNTQDILVTDTTKVTITNNTITINPGFDLDLSNNYHITVDAGAFVNAGSVASAAVSDVAAMNFSTVTPADGLLNVTNAITNATSQAMDATGNLVASYSWMDIEGVGAPSSANGTVRDLSTGNIAMVFKDYDTTVVAGGAQDGIGAPDLYVSATNFGAGDLLYVDNQLNTQPNDLAISSFFNDTPSNGVTQISFGTGVGGLGGLVEVTPVGAPTPSFVTALELQTLLQTTYIPIVSA